MNRHVEKQPRQIVHGCFPAATHPTVCGTKPTHHLAGRYPGWRRRPLWPSRPQARPVASDTGAAASPVKDRPRPLTVAGAAQVGLTPVGDDLPASRLTWPLRTAARAPTATILTQPCWHAADGGAPHPGVAACTPAPTMQRSTGGGARPCQDSMIPPSGSNAWCCATKNCSAPMRCSKPSWAR